MSVIIDATVGGINANSYETEAEADSYFDARLPLVPPWSAAADPTAALAMATRTLDANVRAVRMFVPATSTQQAFWRTTRGWTGAPATSTQRLAWPRTGMYDMNGNAIPSNVIPQALKDAESELAGILIANDRTLDSDVTVQGVTSIRAGSVALTFKDYIEHRVLPDAVWALMPPSWFTDEVIELVFGTAQFDIVSNA